MSYVLYIAKPAFGVPDASPFATKAESLLRLAGVPHTKVHVNPTTGPRKKIPYLACPDGTVITDTRNIRAHLGKSAGLTLASTPADILVRRVVEDHLYWVQVYFRWVHHPEAVRDELFSEVPWPLRGVVFGMVRRQVVRDLWGQGLGRRPKAEILELVEEDLDAIEHALGEGPFFGGDRLSDADLSVHGLLDQLVLAVFDDALTQAVRARPRLVELHQRITEQLGSVPCNTPS